LHEFIVDYLMTLPVVQNYARMNDNNYAVVNSINR